MEMLNSPMPDSRLAWNPAVGKHGIWRNPDPLMLNPRRIVRPGAIVP
jgi:hypothetical protein